MEYLQVLLAAVAAYAFGAVWYITLSKPWIAASGIAVDASGKPQGGGSVMPMVIGFVCILLVAGMTRHIFGMAQMDTLSEGLMGGFGLGAFIITPWLAMCYNYAMRPVMLIVIDAAYAIAGCTIIGVVLTLF